MAEAYDPHRIEAKWRQRWAESDLYRTDDGAPGTPFYLLLMFPYPSGPLHCGHWFMYAPPDAKARYLRMKGHNVLFPMGFDAFGLPAENAAIKRGIHPKSWTYDNIQRMRDSFRSMGASFDWGREVITCDPGYYKWTQWLFLEFFKHGLAYRAMGPVDWCPSCNTSVAREQIVGEERACERCQTPVLKRDLEQWFFRITRYAEELLDFSHLELPERVRVMQTNWIGRSDGVDIDFELDGKEKLRVFSTRCDTIFGVSFLAIAPEHPLVTRLTAPAQQDEVQAYVAAAKRQSEIHRLSTKNLKTGVFIGAYAHNPVNGERVPIYAADYVLMQHGTGAVMGVPAHDSRDLEFARVHSLEVRTVIVPDSSEPAVEATAGAYVGEGKLVSSSTWSTSERPRGSPCPYAELAMPASA